MERAVQEERSRIARDLHDDLGANLTGIALQIDVARKVQDPALFQPQLQNLAADLRLAVSRMREAVWTINPNCDTLESFCIFLGQHADTFLQAAGLRCRLDIPLDLPPRVLTAEVRHHLMLMAKEALNNAVKHAGASEVRIELRLEGRDLVLVIEDNGRGIPGGLGSSSNAGITPDPTAQPARSSLPGSGHGATNMRQRLEALGGELQLQSLPGAGTRVQARLPLPETE